MIRDKGFVLIATVFILLVLGITGIMLASMYSSSAKMAAEYLDSLRAMAVADAGVRWTFEHEFSNDLDFSDNTTAPTDPPYGSASVPFAGGEFWVQYSGSPTRTTIRFTVTARVRKSVRRVQADLTLRPTKALRQGIHDTYDPLGSGSGGTGTGIDLRRASALPVESESTGSIQLPSGFGSVRAYQNSFYKRYLGIRTAALGTPDDSWGGTKTVPPDPAPTGTLWQGNLVLDGGSPSLNGCLIGTLELRSNATCVWTAVSRDIDGNGQAEILPAVTGSVTIQAGSSLTLNNGVAGGKVTLNSPCTFSTNAPVLAAVETLGVGTVTAAWGPGSGWLTGSWGLQEAPQWMRIVGPDVEYELTWSEVVDGVAL